MKKLEGPDSAGDVKQVRNQDKGKLSRASEVGTRTIRQWMGKTVVGVSEK